jgi:hypothetical protein
MIRIRPNKPLALVLSFVLIGFPLFAETEGSLKKKYPDP